MNVVVLYVDPGIGRLLQEVMECEGHEALLTANPEEAFRAIEESDGPSLLFADNYLVSPTTHEALVQLAATSTLRRRVRVIGVDIPIVRGMSEGLVDDFLEMRFTVKTLLATIEANIAATEASEASGADGKRDGDQ